MSQNMTWISINYKQNQPFEKNTGMIFPTYLPVGRANDVYVIQVPSYCLDSNNRVQNSIMWALYPQFANYDFASGQV